MSEAPEWRTHDHGCLNLEAHCPSNPSRMVIIPQPVGKFDWSVHRENLLCTCCNQPVDPDSITRFMVNNVTWGYKGTLVDGSVIGDRGQSDDGIETVLDGQRGWQTLVFATIVPVAKFECYLCKNQCPVENNCFSIQGKEFCGECARQVEEKKRAAAQAQREEAMPVPVLENIRLEDHERSAGEDARRQRLAALKQESQEGTPKGGIFKDIPKAFTPKDDAAYEAHISSLDAQNQQIRDNAAAYDSNYNTVANSAQGMRRGGPPPPGAGGAMKRGGPGAPPPPGMARGGGPPPPGGGPGMIPKKKYERGQEIKTQGPPKEAQGPSSNQPKIDFGELMAVQLKSSAPRGNRGGPPPPQPANEMNSIKLKPTPRKQG